jgi:RNA polymerase sigma-70 factor (ECF subfamily)
VDGRELELIHRARAGDASAFEALLEPVLPAALQLACGMLRRHCDAEDCVQEAALRSWARLGNVEPGRPFRPWFLGIVANRCRERPRSRWWSVTWLTDRHASSEGDWLEGEDLRQALARLRHRHRVAIVLHFYVGLSHEEVAATMGTGVAGVKSNINRGLRSLRVDLGAGR